MKQFKRALVIGALMVVALSVGLVACTPAVVQVTAEADQVGDVPGLVDVLKLMAEGVGVGAVIAFLFERFKWTTLSPDETRFAFSDAFLTLKIATLSTGEIPSVAEWGDAPTGLVIAGRPRRTANARSPTTTISWRGSASSAG